MSDCTGSTAESFYIYKYVFLLHQNY